MDNEFLQKKRNIENDLEDNEFPEQLKKKKINIEEKKPETTNTNSPNKITEKTSENDAIIDLVFKNNITSGNIKCKLCQKEITNNIKFYCDECDYIFCINCFLLSIHNKEHSYHIFDALNFPLFIDNWTAKEEHKLLSFVEKCGLNNWEEISKSLENKGQVECEAYYYTFYYKGEGKENYLPDEAKIILDANKKINNEKLQENKKPYEDMISKVFSDRGLTIGSEEEIFPKNNTRSISFPRNGGVGESVPEVLGARIKRKEFDNEFLNDIEVEMSHLEFNENDKKKEKELQIKMDVLKDYNLILKEREARKKFILEKNMLDMGRQNRIESRLNKEEYSLLLFMKPFHRFFENSEFYDLLGNIIIEQQLKLMLKNLNKLENEKNSKGAKISTIEDLEKYYENDKGGNKSKKREKEKNHNTNNNLSSHINNEHLENKDKDKENNLELKEDEENETNLLINRIERYFNYDKIIKDKTIKEIFDQDEYNLIKEMPLARNIFYDIKTKIKVLTSKFEDKNNIINKKENLKENIKKLIDNYQLEKQTNSDIFDFYCTKYKDLINFNENKLKIEEENKNKIQEKEITLEEKEEIKDESIKSSKHKGRSKKSKHKNLDEDSHKINNEKEKKKDKNKNNNMEIN